MEYFWRFLAVVWQLDKTSNLKTLPMSLKYHSGRFHYFLTEQSINSLGHGIDRLIYNSYENYN